MVFFKNLNKKFALTNQKSFISSSSLIKIGNLLSLIKLFKYISIMFIFLIKNPKNSDIARKISSDLYYTLGANILLKIIFSI